MSGKVVLDTNCLLMAISSRSRYYPVWQSFLQGEYTLCVTTDILEEYEEVLARNINQRVEVDSIRCDFDRYPYEVTTYARQFIVRPSNVTERNLITTCTLQNAVRSDNNPQGFLMEHFLVRENRDIQTYKR